MPVTIFHVGLPLDQIPAQEQPKIAQRLSDLQQRMRSAGYVYEVIHVSPSEGLDELLRRVKREQVDGVVVGGGMLSNPDSSHFLERMINSLHDTRPQIRVMFFNDEEDVRTTVGRWFPPNP